MIATKEFIPLCLFFVASLGTKFNYFERDRGDDLFSFLIVFEKIKDKVNDFFGMRTVTNDLKDFKSKFSDGFFDNVAPSKAQRFIQLQMKLAKKFLSENQNVKVISADKGGRTVITDVKTYKQKVKDFISKSVLRGTYYTLGKLKFEYVKELCESKFKWIISIVNVFLEKDRLTGLKDSSKAIVSEPFIISRFYGLFKVHKVDLPVRPIISSTNNMGRSLEKWMLNKLGVIANRLNKHQIKNAHQLYEKLNGMRLPKGHVLVTWDFDNMFTNIPF